MRGSLFVLLCCLCCLPALGDALSGHVQRLEQADRLLVKAAQQPAQAEVYVRQAASLTPAGSCPALEQAVTQPDREMIARARREVRLLRHTATVRPASGNATDPQVAREALRTVMHSGEYTALKKGSVPKGVGAFFLAVRKAWMKFWGHVGSLTSRFIKWVSSRFPKMPHGHGTPNKWMRGFGVGLKYLLIFLLIAIVLYLLGLLVSRILVRRYNRAAHETEAADDSFTVTRKQEPTFWERSLQQADTLWQHGNQREAMRLLHRACLVLLDTRGILRLDETRANGEVLRELRRQGRTSEHEALRPIIRHFDRSWYGYLPITGDEFANAVECGNRLRSTVVGES